MTVNAANTTRAKLAAFAMEKSIHAKGPLFAALVLTEQIKARGLLSSGDRFLRGPSAKRWGYGKRNGQEVLRPLGVGTAQEYVGLLREMASTGTLDLDEVASFWRDRIRDLFAGKPFRIEFDESRGLRMVVRDIVERAEQRQASMPGSHYVATAMQHLVGAQLDLTLGAVGHNKYSLTNESSVRVGHFLLGDTILHVTEFVRESLVEICRADLRGRRRPVIATPRRALEASEIVIDEARLGDQVDVFDVEQFVALSIYLTGKVTLEGRKTAVVDLVKRYNELVERFEADSSLKIGLRQQKKPRRNAA
jgi:hypothetical protein